VELVPSQDQDADPQLDVWFVSHGGPSAYPEMRASCEVLAEAYGGRVRVPQDEACLVVRLPGDFRTIGKLWADMMALAATGHPPWRQRRGVESPSPGEG
jgi:hypothetical protein